MQNLRRSLPLRPRTKKLLRAVPLLALSGASVTLFFGEGVQAAPYTEGGDPHLADGESPEPMAATPHWEENYTNAECTSGGYVAPCDGEERHWVATQFEPNLYPFVATKVKYTLWGNRVAKPNCDATLGHKVSVWRGTKAAPPSTPLFVQTIVVPHDKSVINDRHVEVTLPQGVMLGEGDILYVSIQNNGEATATAGSCNGLGKYTCAATCDDEGRGLTSFWSNANAAPFSWATLASYEIEGDVRIGVYGYNP